MFHRQDLNAVNDSKETDIIENLGGCIIVAMKNIFAKLACPRVD